MVSAYLKDKQKRMKTQKHILDLHTEHNEWLEDLAFYQDELKIWGKRLSEIPGKNRSIQIESSIKRFQKEIRNQQEEILNLIREIKEHEHALEVSADSNPEAFERLTVEDHPRHREHLGQLKSQFEKLRHEAMEFVSKIM